MLKKIVIIGPESTGKTTLCTELANHFNAQWVPEYAREYLLKNGTDYDFEDLLTIAQGQLRSEDAYTQQASGQKLLFIDTDMYVMKVWCEFVFGKCHSFVLDELAKRKYDLYLLCNTDLPWVRDELREYPDLETRQHLYELYKSIMIHQSTPWADVRGNHAERLAIAIKAVENLLVS